MAWEHCIPIDSMKSKDDYFDYNNGTGVRIDQDETNPAYLVGQNFVGESQSMPI